METWRTEAAQLSGTARGSRRIPIEVFAVQVVGLRVEPAIGGGGRRADLRTEERGLVRLRYGGAVGPVRAGGRGA